MVRREMLEQMDANEFAEWKAYYRIYPWGWEIDNWRIGLLVSTIINTAGKTSKQNMQPKDFYPQTTTKQSDAQMKAVARGMIRG